MKLHLPTLFRKAVLACLSALVVPVLTLASGATAAGAAFGPTLDRLHDGDPTAYPRMSAYELVAAQEGDAGAFAVYEKDGDGELTARYYTMALHDDVVSDGASAVEDVTYGWVWSDERARWELQEGASSVSIVYHSKPDARGRHLVFSSESRTEFGDASGDTTLSFYWDWMEYGLAENDGREPSFSAYRWFFTAGEGDSGITYTYLASANNERREVYAGDSGAGVDGYYVGRVSRVGTVLTGAQNELLETRDVIFGGALYNEGVLSGVSADFVSNGVISVFSTEYDLYAPLLATNIAAGGAVYNAADGLTGDISGNFIGNYAYVHTHASGGMNMYGENYALLVERALGGAIYNAGTMGAVAGNFIGNYVKIERTMLPSFYTSNKPYNSSLTIHALGGAVYNANEIFSISGNFVSNNAYNEHHTSIGYVYSDAPNIQTKKSTYASGGAVFNGFAGSDEAGAAASVESIKGCFVDNFAYNVSAYQFAENGVFPKPPGGGGDAFSDTRHMASGGAIYNGVADSSDGSATFSAHIGSIEGDFTGNYAHMKNYQSRLLSLSSKGGLLDTVSLMRSFAFGGAIYSGIDFTVECGNITTSIGDIGGHFTGNYAFAERITKLDSPTDINIASGGAIYNGAADIVDNNAVLSSSIESIEADFAGNYAQAYDNGRGFTNVASGGAISNSIADVAVNGGSISSSIGYITGDFANNEAYASGAPETERVGAEYKVDNTAFGGAIASGIIAVADTDGTISVSVGNISGNYTGNVARVEFGSSISNSQYFAVVTNYGMGGAIASVIMDVANNGATVQATLGDIKGDFTANAVHMESTLSASKTKMYGKGGAIANAVCNISGNDGEVISIVGDVTGHFVQNSVTAQDEAYGGAVYNGNRNITDNYGTVSVEMGMIIGDFVENYVKATSSWGDAPGGAKGGAIYNASENIATPGAAAKISGIVGDFIGNNAIQNQSNDDESIAAGGAIFNFGYIGEITGHFINNKVVGKNNALGGALVNGDGIFEGQIIANKEYLSHIESIEGNFIMNSVEGGKVSGGAIMNGLQHFGWDYYSNQLNNNSYGRFEMTIGGIVGGFEDNHVTASNGNAFGGAVGNGLYNYAAYGQLLNSGGRIMFSIGSISGGDFVKNSGVSTAYSFGGAVANGIGTFSPYANIDNSRGEFSMSIERIESDFVDNRVETTKVSVSDRSSKGGALFNGFGKISSSRAINNAGGVIEAKIGEVRGNFTNNTAYSVSRKNTSSTQDTTFASGSSGGAIYNGIGSPADYIRNITNTDGVYRAYIEAINGTFKNNAVIREGVNTSLPTYAYVDGHAYGGAIFNGLGGVDYSGITLNEGGEISATIDKISGNFEGNYAKDDANWNASSSGRAYGGAIFNGICSTIGKPTTGGKVEANIGSITGVFRGNYVETSSARGQAYGGAIYNSGSIGRFGEELHEGAYDGSVTGGVLNASFYHNQANGGDAHGGGIWTVGKLAIVADGGASVFSGNTAGGESSGLYIASTDSVVYLIAQAQGTITFDDIIEGTLQQGKTLDEGALSTLRLRGYTENTGTAPDAVGGVYLNHYVKNTHLLMDDVTLYLGVSNMHNPEAMGPVDKTRVINTVEDATYNAEYISRILEESNLTVNTGVVNTVDGLGTNYIINKLVTTSESAPDASERYASFAIDIVVGAPLSDTMHVVVNDNGYETEVHAQRADVLTIKSSASAGFVTLSQLVMDELMGTDPEIGRAEDDVDGTYGWDDPALSTGDNRRDTTDPTKGAVSNYDDYYAQIINYQGDDYEEAHKTDRNFKIQLDISGLSIATYEKAHMSSSDVLAKELELVSVRTYHDSLHVVGWRDPLAAWAEFDGDAAPGDGDVEYKSFTIYQGHTQTLTRNINLQSSDEKRTDHVAPDTSPLMTGTDLRIIGHGVTSVLNVNRKNMLTLVGDGQNVRLQNLTLQNVQTDAATMKDITTNMGNLTLDTVTAYESYSEHKENRVNWLIDNQAVADADGAVTKRLTVTGRTDINYAITTTGGKYGEMLIDNSTGVDANGGKSTISIWNAVSHQNIEHNEVAATRKMRDDDNAPPDAKWEVLPVTQAEKGDLPVIWKFNPKYSTVTHLHTTSSGSDAPTYAFSEFRNNSLDMQDGLFHLHDMATNRLVLRDLNINNGSIYVASAKVDLQNRRMGGIDTITGNTLGAAPTGVIWLGKFEIMNDASRPVTHVKFVDTTVGQRVMDGFGLAQNRGSAITMQGRKYQYRVSYANTKDTDTTAAADKQGQADPYNHIVSVGNYGYYTFVRSGMSTRLNPGPVTQQASVFPMIQMVFDHSFHHADLYADVMAAPVSTPQDEYIVVTPVKGKEYADPAVSVAARAGSMAPDYTAAERRVAYRGGAWLRPYSSFESVPLRDGPKVDATRYGALVGIDMPVTDHDNGWASVCTMYLGYNGSRLRWDKTYRTMTNGGLVGVTETLYKRHFFTALTANAGFTSGDTHSVYGGEDYNMYTLGVAWRSGYNIELAQGEYVIQPAVQLSYMLGTVDSYTNAEGVRMKASPMHAFQVSPRLKVIKHTERDWKPYLTGAYVWTPGGKSKFTAEGDKLPGMSLRPYVEYGVGIQKTWADTYTIYGQATGYSLGRQGFEVSVGARWAW